MILTYNLKHGKDFSAQLNQAKKIAEFAIRTKSNSSRDVRHIGLKSAIANQILRKYRKKRIKKTSSVKLTVPGQSIKYDKETRLAEIPCLDVSLDCRYLPEFESIRQIEIGKDMAHVSVQITEPEAKKTDRFIGIDCNTTGHAAVVAIPHTGKIHKLGKTAIHAHNKYKQIRKKLQKRGKFSLLKKIKNKESRIIRNINHHISKKIVEIASSEKSAIRFENLKGIRKNKKNSKNFRYSLNSWSYYQLQKLIQYKAKKQGIEVSYVAPAYTSQTCSKCGSLGNREGKKFQCVCGHVDHADVNAAFNIGKPVLACQISHCAVVFLPKAATQSMVQSCKERDLHEGSTDTPHAAIAKMLQTVEPRIL